MTCKYAYFLPILCLFWFSIAFIITYIISLYNEDIVAVIPYISDTGTWSPASCIFSLMVNIGAIIQGLIVYIRYRQVKYLFGKETFKSSVKKTNGSALVLGIVAAFGVCVVANFQETNALVIHLLGAAVAFGLGSVYLSIQTYISFKIYPTIGNKTINVVRLILSVSCCLLFFVTFIFAGISFLRFTGDDYTKWTENHGGYVEHFISAVAEWILVYTVIIFLFLFTAEFKKLAISEPMISENGIQSSGNA